MSSHGDAFPPLHRRALELGFDRCAAVPAGELTEELARFRQWLADGRHGTMDWLARDPDRRADPRLVLDGCRTVVILTMNYLRPSTSPTHETPTGRISKYALTRDYHRAIEKRLRKLARYLDEELVPGALSRGYVDYGPILERAWAQRAGLGFIGKHTLLIDPARGSFFFLAVLLTTAELESPPPLPASASCGDCRRCIDACPTGAIDAPYQLDARRCLSYLTIEHTGPPGDVHLRDVSGWVFGCDICQDVCPYNKSRAVPLAESPLGPLLLDAAIPLHELIRSAGELLDSLANQSSPLKRLGREGLLRNAIVAAIHHGDARCLTPLEEAATNPANPPWLRDLALAAAASIRRRIADL